METRQSCAGLRMTMCPDWTAAIGVGWPTLLGSRKHSTASSGSIVLISVGSGSRFGCRYALMKGVKVTGPMAEIRIVLVDDHPIFRHGLRTMLAREVGLKVVDEAADAASALSVVERSRPHVVLLDLRLSHASEPFPVDEGWQVRDTPRAAR